ncbi:hypothetical protein V3C99_003507 [Haemonchus contortus]|uniref:Secreted protein n=2 Tax=Haemonchus TaxID=6288 RepID=A0A0N4X327_HAEPC|nr:unnamed protein product [Haemonchus placei]
MSKVFVHIFLICGLSYGRHVRRSADEETTELAAVATKDPPAPDTIFPVQHVREIQSGYLTLKDSQLGSGSAETEDATSPPCVPRNSPEGIARLYIIAKQKAEESKATTVPPSPGAAAADPSADPATKLSAGDELPPVIDGPTKPPFNDTTPFNGIDVSEVMELRIVKPLCDY